MKKNEMVRRVVYVVENTNTPQFRYRVKNIIDVLRDDDKWSAEYYIKGDLNKLRLDNVKMLIIVRQTAKDRTILNLIKKAKKLNITVLFDLDDLVFDYRDLRVLMESVCEKNTLYWLGYIWGIRRIAKRVDGFICTNDYLAEKLKRSFAKPVKVIRNSLNREQVELSKELIEQKKKKKERDFTIGYFSGSPTHERDFRMIESELVGFLNQHEDAKLKIVGYMRISNQLEKLVGEGKVEIREPVNYLELLRLVSEVEVNIAPLVINDFTNCKSELKYFEAGVVKTTTIASPVFSFVKAISDNDNGMLARRGEWRNKLEYLYQHCNENKRIAKNARAYVLDHYYGSVFLSDVKAAYDSF